MSVPALKELRPSRVPFSPRVNRGAYAPFAGKLNRSRGNQPRQQVAKRLAGKEKVHGVGAQKARAVMAETRKGNAGRLVIGVQDAILVEVVGDELLVERPQRGVLVRKNTTRSRRPSPLTSSNELCAA
jgi:hypothetical protein